MRRSQLTLRGATRSSCASLLLTPALHLLLRLRLHPWLPACEVQHHLLAGLPVADNPVTERERGGGKGHEGSVGERRGVQGTRGESREAHETQRTNSKELIGG